MRTMPDHFLTPKQGLWATTIRVNKPAAFNIFDTLYVVVELVAATSKGIATRTIIQIIGAMPSFLS